MNDSTKTALVKGALAGDAASSAALRMQFDDLRSAQQVADTLLAVLPDQNEQVEAWLQEIVDKHPALAAPIGRELRRKIPLGDLAKRKMSGAANT